ncbi:MAG: TIGR01459 family HAD-type hydrolase [Rickettsiales bacterium]|nr:MAG: TIGR01459 family HAD-type hydrolase [Rickettsiales bacterium]
MTQLEFKQLSAAIDDYDLILFDIWGVIVEGGEVYDGVVDAINKVILQKEVIFLSNAPRPAFKVINTLRGWGISDLTEEMITTSGDLARKIILQKKESLGGRNPVIYHLGADRNDDILSDFDHDLTDDLDKAEVFLLSIYRDDNEDIHEFDELLKQAAKKPNLLNICSNPDTTIPKRGSLRYCAGYFAEIIEQHGGEVVYTGKPKTTIYDEIFRKKPNIKKNRILMVGDTFETDILGANDSGIHSALVLSGNSEPFHNMHSAMEDKLVALQKRGMKVGSMPNFVTKLV